MKIEEAKDYVEENACEGYFENQVVMPKEEILALLDQIELDQPKPVLKKEHAEWLEELKNEFPDDLPNQLYHITRQGWGYGLVFESITGQKRKISSLDGGKLKKDLVNALIYGYTVEKEKLYQVCVLGKYLKKWTNENHQRYLLEGEDIPHQEECIMNLTEQEIKEADERLWQFAKGVTE